MTERRGDRLDEGTGGNGAPTPDEALAEKTPSHPTAAQDQGTGNGADEIGAVPHDPSLNAQAMPQGPLSGGQGGQSGGASGGGAGNGGNGDGGSDATGLDGLTEHQRKEGQFDRIGVLGHAAMVMMSAPQYRHLFVTDVEWMIMPAVALNQFRVWRNQNMPVVFATWAFLGPRQEERMREGVTRLAPTDWKSGDQLWLVDLIAPFGGRDEAIQDLKKSIFPNQTIKVLAATTEDAKPEVVEW